MLIPAALNRSPRRRSEEEIVSKSSEILAVQLETVREMLRIRLIDTSKLRVLCATYELKQVFSFDVPMRQKYEYVAQLYGMSYSSVRQLSRNHPQLYRLIFNT
jgi:DNA polymerase elongation subunit (family B)